MTDAQNTAAGPTTGKVSESTEGKQVIADEAAAQKRSDAVAAPKSEAPVLEPGVVIESHRSPNGTIRIWRWPSDKGVFANMMFFENGVTRTFVFPVMFTGDTADQFKVDGPMVEIMNVRDLSDYLTKIS